MGVRKDVSAIMCQVRADPCPSCQERGDTKVSTWFDGSVVVRIITVRVNGRGVVACIIVILVEKITKECLKWYTLVAPGVREVQNEGT